MKQTVEYLVEKVMNVTESLIMDGKEPHGTGISLQLNVKCQLQIIMAILDFTNHKKFVWIDSIVKLPCP